MSFRNFLAFVAMFAIPVLKLLAQDAVPLPDVANSKYQIDGVVNVDSVYVRSGPDERYYPTGELPKGTSVTVVGIKYDWLKVLPPAGSFSYVGAVFVDQSADGKTGKINRNDVNIRAGSSVNAMKTTVQTRLNMGDTVEILGKEDEYLKIKPPTGAYLYINKQFVTIARPVVASTPPAPQQASTPAANNSSPAASTPPAVANTTPTPAKQISGPSIDVPGTILTAAPTTAPSQTTVAKAPTTAPSPVASAAATQPAVAEVPKLTPEELFAQYETTFADISKQPLDQQPLEDLITKYQGISGNDQLSDELKNVVTIRIATLKARIDNKAKLVEVRKLEKLAAARQLAYEAEQQELTERLKSQEVQVFTAVGQLQPSSLQIGGGTLYRLVDPATGRTEIYVRTSDSKITSMMGQFIGVKGEPTTDPQLSLRLIEPTDAQQVDESKVNASVMASIVPPSMLARQASSN